MKNRFIFPAALAILALGAMQVIGAPESTDSLEGSNVVNKEGETIGKLKDFVFDQNSKELQFAVVESGAVLGMGGKSVLVPWSAFQIERNAEDDTTRVILDATSDKLQGAIEYDPDKPIQADQVNSYWESTPQAHGTTPQEPSPGASNPGMSR